MPKVITAAGGLVLNPNNEILMIFRRGHWDLPKGKLDEGETIAQCAVREVMEETGLIDIELDQFLLMTTHAYFDQYIQEDVIKETHWFVMHINQFQEGIPQVEEDIEKMHWVAIENITPYLEQTYPTIKEVISAKF